MVFSEKWLQNHPKFLLHFLIHIDVLILCRKFDLIPTKYSGVISIFSNWPILKKAWTIAHVFFLKNGSEITPNFYYIF